MGWTSKSKKNKEPLSPLNSDLLPKYIPYETEDSFKARVKVWERITGKKYPIRIFGLASPEEKILKGNTFLRGLNKYTSYASEDDLKEYERELTFAKANDPEYQKIAAEAKMDTKHEKKWSSFAALAKRTKGAIPNFDTLDPYAWKEFNSLKENYAFQQEKNKRQLNNPNPIGSKIVKSTNDQVIENRTDDRKIEEPIARTGNWSTVFDTLDEDGNPMVLTRNERRNFDKEFADIPLDELPNRNRNRWIWGG